MNCSTRIRFGGLLAVLVFCLFGSVCSYASDKKVEEVKWEYKVKAYLTTGLTRHLEQPLEGWLNKLGEQGWELVDVKYDPNNSDLLAVFKRPKR